MEAEWKIDGIFKADASLVYQEIGESGTRPEEILEKAKDPNSELHKCFEWDDTIAAEKYRISQARKILTFLVIKQTKKESMPIRLYHLDKTTKKYESVRKFLVDEKAYKLLLMQAKADCENLRKKYSSLTELEDVFAAIDAL